MESKNLSSDHFSMGQKRRAWVSLTCLLFLGCGAEALRAENISISGPQSSRINVSSGQILTNSGQVSFSQLTNALDNGGALYIGAGGGAILDSLIGGGTLEFTSNSAANGGAVYVASGGQLTLGGSVKFTGNSAANGGAIYVAGGGQLTLAGSAEFSNNTATITNLGDALYNSGTANFSLGTDDTITFVDGIYNTGSVNVMGTLGSLFKIEKDVQFRTDDLRSAGSLLVKGEVDLYIAGPILQNKISFQEQPILSFIAHTNAVSELTGNQTGGYISAKTISGDTTIKFFFGKNIYGQTSKKHINPYNYAIGSEDDDYDSFKPSIELFPDTFKKNGISLSKVASKPTESFKKGMSLQIYFIETTCLFNSNGGSYCFESASTVTVTNMISSHEIMELRDISTSIIDLDANSAQYAHILGPILFDAIGAGSVDGVLRVGNNDNLVLWAGGVGKYKDIVFKNTMAKADIHNTGRGSNGVDIILEANRSLQLSKGISGTNGRLKVTGPGTLVLEGIIDQYTIDFEKNPTIFLKRIKESDSHILVQNNGSLAGSVIFRTEITGAEALTFLGDANQGVYKYLRSPEGGTLGDGTATVSGRGSVIDDPTFGIFIEPDSTDYSLIVHRRRFIGSDQTVTYEGSHTFSSGMSDNEEAAEGWSDDANGHGSIYNLGTLEFILGANDRVVFDDNRFDSSLNSIYNAGSMVVEGALGSYFKLGKNVKILTDDEKTVGRLLIRGGVEFALFGSVVQRTIEFQGLRNSWPHLDVILAALDNKNKTTRADRTTVGGGYMEVSDSISGFFVVEAIFSESGQYPITTSSGDGEYRYAYGLTDFSTFNPIIYPEFPRHPEFPKTNDQNEIVYGLSLGDSGVGKSTLYFRFPQSTYILSGLLTGGCTGTEDCAKSGLITNRGAMDIGFSIADVAIDLSYTSTNGLVLLQGPVIFDSMGSGADYVIKLGSYDSLYLWARDADRSIVFKDTQASKRDIYGVNTGDIYVTMEANAYVQLSKGIEGGNNLIVTGPGRLVVGEVVKDKYITFENSPILQFDIETLDEVGTVGAGSHIELHNGGTITGSARIAVTLPDSMDSFDSGKYTYIKLGTSPTTSNFTPTSMGFTELRGEYYGVQINLGSHSVTLRKSLTGDITETRTITAGVTESIVNAVLGTSSGEAMVIEGGAEAILDGTLTLKPNAYESGSKRLSGSEISVGEEGAISGAPQISLDLSKISLLLSSLNMVEYKYIQGYVDWVKFTPTLDPEVEFGDAVYRVLFKVGDQSTITFRGGLSGDIGEKLTVEAGVTENIHNVIFAVENDEAALEVKTGGTVIISGNLTLKPSSYSADPGGAVGQFMGSHIVVREGATLRSGDNGVTLHLDLSNVTENFSGGGIYNYIHLNPRALMGDYEAHMDMNYDTFSNKEYDLAHSISPTYGTVAVLVTDITGEISSKMMVEAGRSKSIYDVIFNAADGEILEVETGGTAIFSGTLVLKPWSYDTNLLTGNYILVHSGSVISGNPTISLDMTSISDDFVLARYNYIQGSGANMNNFGPTLAPDFLTIEGHPYDLEIESGDIVLRRSLGGTISDKQTVETGSTESIRDATLATGEEEALDIESGAGAILKGSLTLKPTAYSEGRLTGNTILVQEGGFIRGEVNIVLDMTDISGHFTRAEYNYIQGEGDWTELTPTLASDIATMNNVNYDVLFKTGDLGVLILWGDIAGYELTEKFTIRNGKTKNIRNAIFNVEGTEGALEVQGTATISETLTLRPKSYTANALLGNQIIVTNGGSLTSLGVMVGVNLADISSHFTRAEYNYIQGEGDWSGFAQQLSPTGTLMDRTYDVLQGDDGVLLVWGDLEGNITEKFKVDNGRTKRIADAHFLGISNISDYGIGALEVMGGGTARIEKTTIFENNVGGNNGAGAVKIHSGGELAIVFSGAGEYVKFLNNRIGDNSGVPSDVVNSGSIILDNLGVLEFEGGGIEGDGSITLGNYSKLSLSGASLRQGAVSFGDETLLSLTIDTLDANPEETERNTRGGLGGMLWSSTTLTGSPAIYFSMSETLQRAIADLGSGGSYRYVYGSATINGFAPSLNGEMRIIRVSSTNRDNLDLPIPSNDQEKSRGAKLVFSENEGEKDYGTVQIVVMEPEEVIRDILERNNSQMDEQEKNAALVFLTSEAKRSSELSDAIESEDWSRVDRIQREGNPDRNMAVQTRAMEIPILLLADMIENRLSFLTNEPPRLETALLVAAVGRKSYGSLKEKMVSSALLNRLWSQLLLNFGSQELDNSMDISGVGFVLGIDHRLRDDFIVGATLNISSNDTSGEDRKMSNSITALSFYGDYDLRTRNLKDLHLSTTMTYGFTSGKDNDYEGKGSVFYLAPRVSYDMAMKNLERKNLRNIVLAPEIAIRYFRVHRDEQSGNGNKISPVNRNILTLAPMARASAIFREKFELNARLGFGYDIYNGGDDSYSITMYDGSSYQLASRSKNPAKFSMELGLGLGYQLPYNTRVSLGYSGRYSSGLTNNGINLNVDWRF
ncbi:MAG: autotransporter domain-containing protein [Rickettsiales bacterium]|nr:autotransporter domain-containing protein [Rickettsiales bacterium]